MLITPLHSVLTSVFNPLVDRLRPETDTDKTLSKLQDELKNKSNSENKEKNGIEDPLFRELADQLVKDIGELNLTRNFLIAPNKKKTAEQLAKEIIELIEKDIFHLITDLDTARKHATDHDSSIDKDDQISKKIKKILERVGELEALCGEWSEPSSIYWESVIKNFFLMSSMFVGLVFSISAGSFLGIAPFSIGIAWFLYELNHNYEASIFGKVCKLFSNIRTQFEKIEEGICERQRRECQEAMTRLIKQVQQLATTMEEMKKR